MIDYEPSWKRYPNRIAYESAMVIYADDYDDYLDDSEKTGVTGWRDDEEEYEYE